MCTLNARNVDDRTLINKKHLSHWKNTHSIMSPVVLRPTEWNLTVTHEGMIDKDKRMPSLYCDSSSGVSVEVHL